MRRRGDRQEFREALNDAQQRGDKKRHEVGL
jgi:hypothetical protein